MRDSSFWEDWLKEMVADAAMSPSDNVWHGIRGKMNGGRHRFYQLIVLPIFVFLCCGIWLNTGTFLPVKLPVQYTSFHKKMPYPVNRYSYKEPLQDPNQTDNISNSKTNHLFAKADKSENATIQLISHTHRLHATENNLLSARPSLSIINAKTSSIQSMFSGILSETESLPNTPVKTAKKNNTFSFQFYITPSVSYRLMTSQYILRPGESLSDRRNHVRHYPATGMEAGIGLIKPLSSRLSIKGGLQVNFSRYQIKGSETEQELVFVSTSPVSGFEESSRMSNADGSKPKKLMNENLQLSVPIGLDYQIYKNKRIAVHAAGSVQPGFTVHASGHLITSNYKNYIQAEHLFRRFNIQSALESYMKVNAGSIDFHAGPQIRYQLLSNIVDLYPVKEHLIDYGFKIGLIKHIR
jgi:hypothetical protein